MMVRYTCSEQDFLYATKLLFRKRQRRLIVIVAICTVVLCYVIIEFIAREEFRANLLQANSIPKIVVGLGLPVLICLTPLFVLRAAKKIFRKSPAISETRQITFDDAGYSAQSASASGHVAWSVYESFYEDKRSFLLMQRGSQIFVPLPKRELSDPQIVELRSILETHLPRK